MPNPVLTVEVGPGKRDFTLAWSPPDCVDPERFIDLISQLPGVEFATLSDGTWTVGVEAPIAKQTARKVFELFRELTNDQASLRLEDEAAASLSRRVLRRVT